ncbi:PaaI family thioesterase [Alteribacillus sp. JSM 102045]|uniref:PaaI family thioesterase n=1 Tax=Alteribacillus sp. JSM 102045 TaxID=1562101 RepID=UPI0035C12482
MRKVNDEKFVMDLGLQNKNIYGVAQGGAIYTLADVAIGFKIFSELKEHQKVFTLELKTNFIKKGKGNQLIAEPRFIHWGNTNSGL